MIDHLVKHRPQYEESDEKILDKSLDILHKLCIKLSKMYRIF